MAHEIILDRAGPALPLIRRNLVKFSPEPFQIAPRPRGFRLNLSGGPFGGGGGGDLEPGEQPAFPCGFFGGQHMQLGATWAIAANQAFSSFALSRPFVVRFMRLTNDATAALVMNVAVKIAQDNDTTGGFSCSGIDLDASGFGGATFIADGQAVESWPNFIWTAVPAFIKIGAENLTGAIRRLQLVVDIEYMS